LRQAIANVNRRAPDRFRVVHFSFQADHVHLIVEAVDTRSLWRGVRGLAISMARRINTMIGRRGRFWADRWHGRDLTSPRAVRNALRYVLCNFRKHEPEVSTLVDPYSSAPYFTGFADPDWQPLIGSTRCRTARASHSSDPPVAHARTWLLAQGWLRHGRLPVRAAPA
jgi:hypothetical protein